MLDYYEPDFADDDPRLLLLHDADTDLRLLDLWQSVSEAGDVFDDLGRDVLANLLRRAYGAGYSDGAEDHEHSAPELWWCDSWRRFPTHDQLPAKEAGKDGLYAPDGS
jgi:hypothetical protein